MMARPSLLLMSVLLGTLAMAHSQRLKPLKESFEIVTGVVIPCGSQCMVQSYREVLQTTERCIISNTGLIPVVDRYLRTNNILNTNGNGPTYQQIYNAMFSESSSPLCGWYRTYGGCLTREFGQDCGSGILGALTTISQYLEPLVCSSNPSYIACATHPSLFGDLNSQQNTGPYATCAITLANNFMNIDYQNYYNNVILRDNGNFLFNNLRTFGKCIGDAVKTVTGPTGCSTAGEDIKKYINDTLDYFHFGMNGKDYLKCFAKPALHRNLTACGQTFEQDLKTLYGNSFLTVLNTTLLNGQYTGLQRPYTRLSSCFKSAFNANCGSEQDSVALVTRMLHPLDHLFGIRSDSPAFCSALVPITPPITTTPPIPTPTPEPPAMRLKPLGKVFEVTTEVIIPCGSRCVVQRYQDVLRAVNTCIMSNTGIVMEAEQYARDNNLGNNPSWNQIYEAYFSEGRSPLCGWYQRYGGCFENQFGRICGSGVMTALTGLVDDFEMLVCSRNPNYLACITHPSLINEPPQSFTSPYGRCLQQLLTAFSNVNDNNYYQALMLNGAGETLFRAIRNFGNCMGDAIKTVPVSPPTGCQVVGNEVKKYINDAVDYFDFGQGGKDYVKCFARRNLHTQLTTCGEQFGSALQMTFDDMTLARLNMTLFIGGYSSLEQPYRSLSACIKRAMVNNCRQETDSINLVKRILHPLDNLYGIRGDNPAFCSAPVPTTPLIPTPTPQPPATGLKPLKDAFEVTTEVIIPCGTRCAVQRYRNVLQAVNTCVISNSGLQMEVQQYIQTSNLGNNPSPDRIYEAFFSEARSPICGWYRRYGRCFEREFGRICGSGIREALTGLIDDFEMLVCSRNPNYLACITHPSLINGPPGLFNNPYRRCLQQVMSAFSNVNDNNYYQALMLNGGGNLLFSTMRNFGNCMGDAIKTVTVSPPTGCRVVGNEVKKYINDAVNYFDFGQSGKDYVKCFARRNLHTELSNCGEQFGGALQMKFEDMTLARLNMTLYIGGYSALQQPYTRLSACVKRAMVVNCRQETDSINLVNRILHPLDHLYGIRADYPTYCDDSSAAAATSVANLGLLLSGLLFLLSIIRRLN